MGDNGARQRGVQKEGVLLDDDFLFRAIVPANQRRRAI